MASDISRVRNIGIVGSHHAGKTTLVEAILAHCGAIGRKGSRYRRHDDDRLRARMHRARAVDVRRFCALRRGRHRCHAGRLPRFHRFLRRNEIGALRVRCRRHRHRRGSLTRFANAHAARFLESRKMPHLFVVNKMDRPGADFAGTLEALQRCYGRHVVAEQWPIGAAESFKGYVDLAESQSIPVRRKQCKRVGNSRGVARSSRKRARRNCSKRWPISTIT